MREGINCTCRFKSKKKFDTRLLLFTTKKLYKTVIITLLSLLISTPGNSQELTINGSDLKSFPLISNEEGWTFNYEQKFDKKSDVVWRQLELNNSGWKQHPKYPYICGYNGDITLKIVSTAPISVMSAQAKIINYSDRMVRKAAIAYSTNGLTFKTLTEKEFGNTEIDATTNFESKPHTIWLRFIRLLEKNDSNGKSAYVVFKSINIKLTGENSNKEQAEEAITIVIPDKAVNIPREWTDSYLGAKIQDDLTQRVAAERLQMLISTATGKSPPIVTAKEMPQTGLRIFVGYGEHLEGRIDPPTKPEGLKIAEQDGNLFLLGEIAQKGTNNWPVAVDRGVMHAVETFAEEVMGYRFMNSTLKDAKMFELGTVIPKLESLEIKPGLLIEDAPVFNTRLCSSKSGPLIGLRSGSSSNFSCNHSYSPNTWHKSYSKKNPQMFVPLTTKNQDDHAAAMDAQKSSKFLDYTEPMVLEKRLEHLDIFFKSGKGREFFAGRVPTHNYIMEEPPDFNPPNWKYNERAKKLYNSAQWGQGTNIWFDYLNRLGKEAKNRWPKMRISALAYYQHSAVPTFDIEDNIDIMLALLRTSMGSKEPYVFDKNIAQVKSWFEKVGSKRERLYLWEYGCWPTMFVPAPIIPAFTMQKWLQTVKPYVSGVFFEYYPKTRQFPDYLMRRIWLRLLWNPDLDVENDIKDFCTHFYGPASDTMFAFYMKLIQRYEMKWDNPKILWDQYYVDPSLYFEQSFPKSETSELLALLNKACKQTGTVSEIIESKVQHGAAAYLFNEKNTPSPIKIVLSTLDEKLLSPSIGWQGGGRVTWQGTLNLGERLEISTPDKAILYTEDRKSHDVSAKLIGQIPELASNQAEVFYFWHKGNENNLFQLKLSYGNAQDIADDSKSIYARRLDWQKTPYMLNPGNPKSLDGFFVNAHLAHKKLKHLPEYKVEKQQISPNTIDDDIWNKLPKSELVWGKTKARYSWLVFGYSTFLRTNFQVVYYNDGIAIRFEADGKPAKDEEIILTLNGKNFKFALDAQLGQNPAMKQFQPNKDGWQALVVLKWDEISKGEIPKTLSCQISRTRNKESYLWSPPLNMWGSKDWGSIEQGPGQLLLMP